MIKKHGFFIDINFRTKFFTKPHFIQFFNNKLISTLFVFKNICNLHKLIKNILVGFTSNNKNLTSMMKNNSVQIRSKSLYKKPSKDIYFPAMQFKNNFNSSLNKNIRANINQKSQEYKKIQIPQINLPDYNPENSISLLSPRKKSEKISPLFKSDKKMSYQSNHPKLQEKSKEWMNKSAIYFTKRQLGLFEKSFIQQEEKRKLLDQKMLEKKQSFESFKKMKQIIRVEQNLDLLSDLQFKKLQRQREKQIRQVQKKLEQNFVHEEKIAKIDMERFLKYQAKRQQLGLAKQKLFETETHSEFLKIEDFKAKRIHMNLLESRLQFLKNEKLYSRGKNGYLTERLTSRKFYGNVDLE